MAKNINQNLAYDFSSYVEEYVESKPKIISKKTVKAKKSKLNPVSIFLVVALVGGITSGLVYNNVVLNELGNEITQMSNELDELNSENTRLNVDLETKTSLRKIEEYATNELGLQRANNNQIEYVRVEQENKIETTQDEENIMDKIINIINSIIDAIKGMFS